MTDCTQSLIAAQVGVSQKTVNLALLGRAGVSRTTGDRIRKVAHRLGYRVNSAARAVRTGRFQAIGLLRSADASEGGMSANTEFVLEECARHAGMHLVMGRLSSERPFDPLVLPGFLRDSTVDGFIRVFTVNEPPALQRYLSQVKTPSVRLNSKHRFDCAYPDDFGNACEATAQLLQIGHRTLAYFSGFAGPHYSTRDRADGFSRTVRTAGFQPMMHLPRDGPLDSRERFKSALTMLQKAHPPTAVLTYCLDDALDVFLAARETGLAVPTDISIVAMDEKVASIGGMSIATMTVPMGDLARAVWELLQQKIDQPDRSLAAVPVRGKWLAGDTVASPVPARQKRKPASVGTSSRIVRRTSTVDGVS